VENALRGAVGDMTLSPRVLYSFITGLLLRDVFFALSQIGRVEIQRANHASYRDRTHGSCGGSLNVLRV